MKTDNKIFTKSDLDNIEEHSDIRDHIPGLKGSGASRYCQCPECGKEGKNKGLIVTHRKKGAGYINIAKCFSCGFSVVGSINARCKILGEDFVTAVKNCADMAGIPVLTASEKRAKRDNKLKDTFVMQQLKGSGLTLDDVKVRVPIPGSDDFRIEYAFRKGGVDKHFNINTSDDEMLIFYYDLDGYPVFFSRNGSSGRRSLYVRVRWSNPAAHADLEGKSVKYQTPYKASCRFYIPEIIRECYRNSTHIDTLVIQEGEKKAEKACKHGIMSLGIQGIYNIGNSESGLLKELQYIVSKCSVRNVVLLFDSDWDALHRRPENGDSLDQRPNQFSKAAIKFRDYVQTLHGLGLSVDVWFGHINPNPKNNKGIDDLLSDTLFLDPGKLAEDMKGAMLDVNGHGEYVDMHKITTLTDLKIRDFWLLNQRKEFFGKYKSTIEKLTRFKFGRISYVVDDGQIKEAARSSSSEFWSAYKDEKGNEKVDFYQHHAIEFLAANNFRRVFSDDLPLGEYKLARIEGGIISEVPACDIREFVMDYVLQSTKNDSVRNHFASRLSSYFGADRLELLPKIKDVFLFQSDACDKVYFKNGECVITSDEVKLGPLSDFVWKENIIDRPFKREKIVDIGREADGTFYACETENSKNCEFLQFLFRTSNFWKNKNATDQDERDWITHFVNKVTAIGYLLSTWKNPSEKIAIVSMDAKMDTVSLSNGRSGKSMIFEALKRVRMSLLVDGKNLDPKFAFSLLTSQTRIVTYDDIKVNFDFTDLYSVLTNDIVVNVKTGGMFKIPFERAPKFYISTNHAINDNSDSGEARRVYMAFSNYYNKNFSPRDDFGHYFFDDWDDNQWNLFYNFMLECIMYYRRSVLQGWTSLGRGVVPPPMKDLQLRQLRQIMGEAFLSWADAFFDPSGMYLNVRMNRKVAFDEFHKEFPDRRESLRSAQFFIKLKAFCKFKGYHLNPSTRNSDGQTFHDWKNSDMKQDPVFIGTNIKSGGVEYIQVTTPEYASKMPS